MKNDDLKLKTDSLRSTFKLVEKWAIERNLKNQNPRTQFLKIVEEFGELSRAIQNISNFEKGTYVYKSALLEIADAIGDILVVLSVTAAQSNQSLFVHDLIDNKKDVFNTNTSISELLAKIMVNLSTFYESDFESSPSKFSSFVLRHALNLLNLLAKFYNLDIEHCYNMAYCTINCRTGKIVNGVFVKDKPRAFVYESFNSFEKLTLAEVIAQIDDKIKTSGEVCKVEWVYE